MPRTVSRSPSYRRRRSPSPVSHRHRRSRRDRSQSPYSYRPDAALSDLIIWPRYRSVKWLLPSNATQKTSFFADMKAQIKMQASCWQVAHADNREHSSSASQGGQFLFEHSVNSSLKGGIPTNKCEFQKPNGGLCLNVCMKVVGPFCRLS